MHVLSLGEAARELGCSGSWWRRAERQGRIPTPRRDMNGWRVYTAEDIDTLRNLRLPGLPQATVPCPDLRSRARSKSEGNRRSGTCSAEERKRRLRELARILFRLKPRSATEKSLKEPLQESVDA